jgi:hypothetical protein
MMKRQQKATGGETVPVAEFKNRVSVCSGCHLWLATGAVRQGNGETAADSLSEENMLQCHLFFCASFFKDEKPVRRISR